jgi:hypothetical protein
MTFDPVVYKQAVKEEWGRVDFDRAKVPLRFIANLLDLVETARHALIAWKTIVYTQPIQFSLGKYMIYFATDLNLGRVIERAQKQAVFFWNDSLSKC